MNSAAEHYDELTEYVERGTSTALALSNRGPIRYDQNGKLHPDILAAYWTHGFYVFEGLVDTQEIAELRADMDYVIEHAPVGPKATVDKFGQPAYGLDMARNPYSFVRPLSDPWGGTELLNGRHQVKMREPTPDAQAPEHTLFLVQGMCQLMPAGLRLYGHPDVLHIAAGINGDDFVPYNDAIFVKQAGLGGAVSWHQDGVTHWDAENWDEGIHGFNFQVQLYECTARNCLWVMPGSHKLGKIDIKHQVEENGGSEMLPGAVPLLCEPGDVTVVNRQMLHCSFPNTSPNQRISLTFGFHRYTSVLGASGALSQTADEVYDEARIEERAQVVQVAIDARAQHRPDETRFTYQRFVGREDQFLFNQHNQENIIKDYVLKDLSI